MCEDGIQMRQVELCNEMKGCFIKATWLNTHEFLEGNLYLPYKSMPSPTVVVQNMPSTSSAALFIIFLL